jgi:hypothetical protein
VSWDKNGHIELERLQQLDAGASLWEGTQSEKPHYLF